VRQPRCASSERHALRPLIRAGWFGRLGYIISAWSLWEACSRAFCAQLPHKAYEGDGSCVDKVERALGANNIPFTRKDWFAGANALRNLLAHYNGVVVEARARSLFDRARIVAFTDLGLYRDHYVCLWADTASAIQWEVGEFIREMAAA